MKKTELRDCLIQIVSDSLDTIGNTFSLYLGDDGELLIYEDTDSLSSHPGHELKSSCYSEGMSDEEKREELEAYEDDYLDQDMDEILDEYDCED